MTQLEPEEVMTSRWTARQRSSSTAGGTSGSTPTILNLSDQEELVCESGMVKGSFSFDSRRTMRMRGPPNIILRNSQSHLKVI